MNLDGIIYYIDFLRRDGDILLDGDIDKPGAEIGALVTILRRERGISSKSFLLTNGAQWIKAKSCLGGYEFGGAINLSDEDKAYYKRRIAEELGHK